MRIGGKAYGKMQPSQAAQETGLSSFPEGCPWSSEQVLGLDWLPG